MFEYRLEFIAVTLMFLSIVDSAKKATGLCAVQKRRLFSVGASQDSNEQGFGAVFGFINLIRFGGF